MEVTQEGLWQQFLEGGLQLATFLRQIPLLKMTDTGNPGRFLHDDQKVVRIRDADVVRLNRLGPGILPQFDNVAPSDFSDAVQTQVAVDLNASSPDRFANIPPAPIPQPIFESALQHAAIVGGFQMENSEGFLVAFGHEG
jgi:hypothetical protein